MRKRIIGTIFIAFLALVLVCTYSTLVVQRRALPRVTMGREQPERLDIVVDVLGIAETQADEYFHVDFQMAREMIFFDLEDIFELTVPAANDRRVVATVILSNVEDDLRTVRMRFKDAGLSGGEQLRLYYKTRATGQIMVPSSAIFEDERGEYMLLVARESGVWGYTYMLERVAVEHRFIVDGMTSLNRKQPFSLPFVVTSTAPVREGDEVRIYE